MSTVKHQPATPLFAGCGFAAPGTYGHECGAPATKVGFKKSCSTKNGVFYARRCDNCAAIKGGDNLGIFKWEKFDSVSHVNQWVGVASPLSTRELGEAS